DVDGDALNFAVASGPTNGTLSGSAPSLVYTPNPYFHGSDSITFTVSDGALSSTNVVSITVLSVNDPPVANPQSISTPEDTAIAITLTASDPDGDPLNYSVLTAPAHGTLSGTGAQRTYTPNANFHGADSFNFSVSDGFANATAAVTITVLS